MADESIGEVVLAERWKRFFPAAIRVRGAAYARDGLVDVTELEEGLVQAVVQGRTAYDVCIDWSDPDAPMGSCTCSGFDAFGPCKHMWALVLRLEGATEAAGRRSGSIGREDPRRSPWRARLDGLRAAVEHAARAAAELGERNPWHGSIEPDFEIRYVISVEGSRDTGGLLVEPRIRRRKKNGGWGAERAFSPGGRGASGLDMSDRRIFAVLEGAGDDVGYFWPRSALAEYRVEGELLPVVLPILVASGRSFARSASKFFGPLVLDEGPSWHPSFDLERDAESLVLRAALVRGEERMDVAEPDFLLDGGYLVVRDVVARFDEAGAWILATELRANGVLRAPVDGHARLLEMLARLPARVLGHVDGMEVSGQGTPRPCLHVESPRDGPARGNPKLDCRIAFEYGSELVAPEDPRELLPSAGAGSYSARDFAAEREALRRFRDCGGERSAGTGRESGNGAVPARRLPALALALTEEGWRVEAEGRRWRRSQGFALSVRSGTDWFDLEGGMDFGGETAGLPALLAAARAGERTVLLGDGSFGLLPERWLEDWGLLQLAREERAGALRFAQNQGWLLDAMLLAREGVEVDAGFARLRERLAGFDGITPGVEPRGFEGTLRGYQRAGLGWFAFLRDLGFGGCLADDMGLGKTVQVLALLESRRCELAGDHRPSLVVAPRSLVFNWIDEAARFTPRLATLDYTGIDRRERLRAAGRVDVLVTTYGTLRRDGPELAERRFDYLVLDESTSIKNASSQSAKAARLLAAEHRLALSGTPIENHLGDLWSLFEFLNPGMLGRSRTFQAFVTRSPGRAGAPDLERLARAIRPFFLRRTKDEVLDDLPEKTEQTIHCELGRSERKDYDELRAHYRASLLQREAEVGLGRMKIHVLEALLRLRQAALHPGLIDPKRTGESSAKLEALLPMLEQLVGEGHKALVFSQFTALLDIVRSRLDASGIPYEYLDGRTRNRKERVARFQGDRACPLFLISLKAGGHGLNLTAADYVFLLDPWWNPAVEAQAVDRAHRIGRTRPVVAYRLIAKATVEEKVLDLQAQKRELVKTLLGDGRAVLKDLTREDLERLLS